MMARPNHSITENKLILGKFGSIKLSNTNKYVDQYWSWSKQAE